MEPKDRIASGSLLISLVALGFSIYGYAQAHRHPDLALIFDTNPDAQVVDVKVVNRGSGAAQDPVWDLAWRSGGPMDNNFYFGPKDLSDSGQKEFPYTTIEDVTGRQQIVHHVRLHIGDAVVAGDSPLVTQIHLRVPKSRLADETLWWRVTTNSDGQQVFPPSGYGSIKIPQ